MQADELFREIRVDNTLTGIDGEPVALREGAHIDVTFEAETQVPSESDGQFRATAKLREFLEGRFS